MMNLKQYIRDIPDFPKKGILFHDVTTLFGNPEAFTYVVDTIYKLFPVSDIRYVAGIEARGFLLAGALAMKFGCGVIPVRKPGKLPYQTISETYELEYGTDRLEIHTDALSKGEKVLVVDDLVATGGTLLGQVRIASDKDTNSLIFITSPRNYDRVRQMVDSLDFARPQVMIEVLVAEKTVRIDRTE